MHKNQKQFHWFIWKPNQTFTMYLMKEKVIYGKYIVIYGKLLVWQASVYFHVLLNISHHKIKWGLAILK